MIEKHDKYELLRLLETCASEKMTLSEDDRAWLSMLSVGQEIIDDKAD